MLKVPRMMSRPLEVLGLPFLATLLVACTGSGVDGDRDAGQPGNDTSVEEDATIDPDGSSEDGGGGDTGPVDPNEPKVVRIKSPAAGSTVSGPITVVLEPVGRLERLVDDVTLSINDEVILRDTKLPTEVVVDTTAWATNRLTLVAEAQDGFDAGIHEVELRTNNPQIRFTEVTPRAATLKNGDVVSVVVRIEAPNDVELSADFSALDSGFEPGQSYAFALGGGEYAVTYVITADNSRRDGTYAVPLTARLGPWTVTYDLFFLRLQNKPIMPIGITNGIFVEAPPPAANPAWPGNAPTVVSTNSTIVTGGTGVIQTNVSDQTQGTDVVGVIISLDGHDGYYQVPVDPADPPADGIVEGRLRLRQYGENESVPNRIHFRVALRDARGRISPYRAFSFNVIKVGGGDIQFTLSWDTVADMDIHIVDPFGCEIYYGRRTCSQSGGRLDLDANIGCSSGPQTENVFWPEGGAPPGTYVAKVNRFSDSCCANSCQDGHNYTMTINYCGRTEVVEGHIPYGQQTTSSGAGSTSGIVVATIDNRACERTAQGRVRYQDKVFDARGFGAFRWKAVEGAVVELRELGTNAVLGTGVTDALGNYLIPFSTQGPGYIVAIRTMTSEDQGLRDIKLYDHPKFKRIYEVTSAPVILAGVEEDTVFQDVDITVDRAAGAFNIFDILRQSYDQVRLVSGRDLGELRGFWATGTDTTDTIYCSEYLYNNGVCTEVGSVSVQGKDTDRDEYDDMVIAREFFKFALNTLARDSHPGEVADGRRDDPRRSWTEGAATFFAADLVGSRHYVDSRPFSTYIVDDLESSHSPFAIGTDFESVSRYLVMSVLWDLGDSDNEDADEIDRLRSGIYDVLFSYLPSETWTDRGPTGVDLTDFLDGWFCRGWGMSDAMVRLLDFFDYGYDFAGPSGCWTP